MPDEKDEIIVDIGEIQQYLRAISIIDGTLPKVALTGEYDLDTRRAVEAFQNQYELPITGIVDAETWSKIFNRYNYLNTHHNHPLGITPFLSTRNILEANQHGYDIYILQSAVNTIAEAFVNIDAVEMTGVMDPLTVNTVKKIQYAAGLPPSGDVNYITWNIIARMYNIFINEVFIADESMTLPSANNVG